MIEVANAVNQELLTNVSPKRGLSLDELLSKAEEIQDMCEDFTVSTVGSNNVRFDSDTGNLLFVPDGEIIRSSPMSRHALSQLCSKVGVPVRYIEKCLEGGMTDLAADNINYWIQDLGKNLFIREHNNRVRGILSDRYMTLDTPDILSVLTDVIDPDQFTTRGYFLSPERFHARIIQNEMMNVQGEDLFAGVQIDSSDVGRSTLIARFFVFKQVCTNGLVVAKFGGTMFEQRHVGIRVDDFRLEFEQSLSRIPDLISTTIDMVSNSRKDKIDLSDVSSPAFSQGLQMSSARLSSESVTKVISLMRERYSLTRWGLVNSLTEVAQDFTLERRIEIERFAGDLLSREL